MMFCRGNGQYCNPTMVRKQYFKMNILSPKSGILVPIYQDLSLILITGPYLRSSVMGENESKRIARLISGIDQQPLQQID